jgi:DNA-binding CsgD family transcriptional regulator/tetratricopeptide (TPR) repeat protein
MTLRISSRELISRREELHLLSGALEGAAAEAPSVVLLVGEAGIGKSRLLREIERQARERDVMVLRGECLQLDGAELPYAPLAAALRDAPAGAMSTALEELGPEPRAAFGRTFPAFAAPSPPRAASDDPGGFAQARLFEALIAVLGSLGRHEPVLLIVEDLHWVDRSTRDFFSFLVRGLRAERLAVVVTYRVGELAPEHPVRELLAELQYHDRVTLAELGPLTQDDVAAQLEGILGEPADPALAEQVYARSGGNPLFVEELLSARLDPLADELPSRLADAIRARVRRAGEPVRRLMPYVAALGRPAGSDLVGAAAKLAEPELSVALREAVDHHLVVHDQTHGTFAFRHDIVREAVYADLLPGERAAIHLAVAEALATAGGGPAELAFHWRMAGRGPEALEASVQAGLEAEAARAYAEALRHFCHAIDAWPGDGAGPPTGIALDRVDLLGHASDLAKHTGDYKAATRWCEQALAELGQADGPRAASFYERLGRLQSFAADCGHGAFREALHRLPESDRVGRARLLGAEGYALWGLGRLDEAARRCEEALVLAQAVPAPAEAAYARMVLGFVTAYAGDPAGGEAHLREAIGELADLPRHEDLLSAHLYLAEVLRLRGRFDRALAVTQEGERHAVRLGMGASFGRFLALNAAYDEILLGAWPAAEARLRTVRGDRLEAWDAIGRGLLLGQLALARGELDEAARELESAQQACRDTPAEWGPVVYAALAELALWRDRPEQARELIREGLAATGEGGDLLYVPALYVMGARVEADLAMGAERESACAEARRLLGALERLLDGAVHRPPSALAQRASCRAELARAEGAGEAECWREAAAAWEEVGAGYAAAYARWRMADALLRTGDARDEAARALAAAHAQAGALGARLLEAEVEALARRARIELTAAAPGANGHHSALDAFGLTERELEVLGLLTQGLTNRQIGERLFIAPKTAGLHVSRILAKLDVGNRTQAAALAHRAGLR